MLCGVDASQQPGYLYDLGTATQTLIKFLWFKQGVSREDELDGTVLEFLCLEVSKYSL